jgi:hypothetical protein
MLQLLGASAVTAIALAIAQLWVLDELDTTFHKTIPAGLSEADGSLDRYWERWCYRIMSEMAILAVGIGLLIGVLAAHYLGESWLPLVGAFGTAAVVWAVLTALLRPNRKNALLWNRSNQKHLFVSVLTAACVGALLITGGGTVPLLIGGGAAGFALFVSFVCSL